MKRYRLFAVCCALACLATGLTYGQSVGMHKYYGPGPYVSPPYWEVPDLTKAQVDAPRSALDLTYKEGTATASTGLSTPYGAWLKGKVVGGRTYPFSRPRTYTDHVTTNTSLMTTRPTTSVQALQYGPTISSTAPRYNASLRYWQITRYRSPMEEHMRNSQSYQPR